MLPNMVSTSTFPTILPKLTCANLRSSAPLSKSKDSVLYLKFCKFIKHSFRLFLCLSRVTKTSSLKSVEILSPKSVIGKNTYEAIQSGLILGHSSMIDSMLEKISLLKEK